MTYSSAIERLSLPSYAWWSEGAHGVAWSGVATVFPSLVGVGSTFDVDGVKKMGTVIGREQRAKHNAARDASDDGMSTGDFQGECVECAVAVASLVRLTSL